MFGSSKVFIKGIPERNNSSWSLFPWLSCDMERLLTFYSYISRRRWARVESAPHHHQMKVPRSLRKNGFCQSTRYWNQCREKRAWHTTAHLCRSVPSRSHVFCWTSICPVFPSPFTRSSTIRYLRSPTKSTDGQSADDIFKGDLLALWNKGWYSIFNF